MSPHGDTVRFVNREKRNTAFLEHVHKVSLHGTLRGDIENPDFSSNCRGFNRALAVVGKRRVQHGDIHALRKQCINLILHQSNQRGDDNGHAGKHQSRKLITQRFAASGGHNRQNIMSRHYRLDDCFLIRTKCLEMEIPLQRVLNLMPLFQLNLPLFSTIHLEYIHFPLACMPATPAEHSARFPRLNPAVLTIHLEYILLLLCSTEYKQFPLRLRQRYTGGPAGFPVSVFRSGDRGTPRAPLRFFC